MDDDAIRTLVTYLSRPCASGGQVIERAAHHGSDGADPQTLLRFSSARDPAEHTSSTQAGDPSEASPRLGSATDREVAPRPGETGPTIIATLSDGPLEGKSIEADVVEGRPPKIIDVPADDGSLCRYCLADWVQAGSSAVYTFLYRV